MSLICISDSATMQLLLPSSEKHTMNAVIGASVGLIPIVGPCSDVTTSGLKWDVTHAELRFGGLISTSNMALSESVSISTNAPLLWTMSFPAEKPRA